MDSLGATQWPPGRQGLYDPANEHDACGLGFIAQHQGPQEPRHRARTGCEILENLTHRGATGADPLQGDGAGILIQLPDAFLRRACGKLGMTLPAIGPLRRRAWCSCRRSRRRGWRASRKSSARSPPKGRCCSAGATCPPTTRGLSERTKEVEPVIRQVFVGRGARGLDQDAFERKLYVIRKRAGHAIQSLQPAARQGVLRPVDVDAHDRLQGHAARATRSASIYLDLADESMVSRAGDGAPALLDQHVPDVGPGASVPLHLPQRRDQHAARQLQLDPRARRRDRVEGAGRRPAQALAADLRRTVRFGVVRQRARAPGDGRLSAVARDDDDDPRGVGRAIR